MKHFELLTENMQSIYWDIFATLGQCFPEQMTDYIFRDDMNVVAMMADYMMLEFVKYSHDKNDAKYPLRHFLNYSSSDESASERMAYSRAIKWTQKYKDIEYDRLRKNVETEPGYGSELLARPMSNINGRLEGHSLTSMTFFEHTTIQSLGIVKAIVEKRISDVKKCSNEKLEGYYNEYSEWVSRLIQQSQKSDEDMVFASLAYFTFEWKFAPEFVYQTACMMEENEIHQIDPLSLCALCGEVDYDSGFGRIRTQSRAVVERTGLLELLLKDGKLLPKTIEWDYRERILQALALSVFFREKTTVTEGGLYKDWVSDNTSLADWASFFRYYDIFSLAKKKEWNNRRLRLARQLYDEILRPKA